ncbi:peptidoglycan D,D-transpeptidase FtsI family protein [Paenibacillus pasadenensis]|uniref:Cell division protein FtsI [Peptidoglycan synthetase] n=1 Tax=Paenibacillus pasadenensis TaxID=217090 RepID=A0A2N5N946_9BACL|nr:penicillin-binding transpeptidase domain-containing protein [Paenibacillus pasadenensis]PLT46854.1 Cell division protein FtsI [Peptidoglycan synthetase] [Paenibacillus pasadenensis]
MSASRMKTAAALIAALLLVALLRLGWVMLWPWSPASSARHATASETAVRQRSHRLLLDAGRGDFVDRSGLPLTGFAYEALAIFPHPSGQPRGSGRDMAELARVLQAGSEELWQELERRKEPGFWMDAKSGLPLRLSPRQRTELAGLKLEGVAILPYRARRDPSSAAVQAIGYVSENPERIAAAYGKRLAAGKASLRDATGGGGLELSLDGLLRGTGPAYASYMTDAAGLPLKGLGLTVERPANPRYPLQVRTTLSLPLQVELQRYAGEAGLKKGAVVVLDVRNSDILAMVSKPDMELPARGEAFFDGAANRAVRAYAPGSIFKLVTEAAALEAGAAEPGEEFYCGGEYGHHGLSCWKEGGHGRLTLEQGLAQSCNIVFAALAERLRPDELAAAADKLGLGRRIGWHLEAGRREGALSGPLRLIGEEEAGTVFGAASPWSRLELLRSGKLARSGIGQEDVRMTPLQAANLAATIVNGGRVAEPALVKEIDFADGQRLAALRSHASPSAHGQISPRTAAMLRRGMEQVVASGTGRGLHRAAWPLAGKSGTAESGRPGAGNSQWFIGYGPADHPRYAVAVLAEERPEGSANLAARLFGGVMDRIAAWERAALASSAQEK